MKASLNQIETGEVTELVPVSMIGRNLECHIAIPDPRVSRRHAMIRKQDGGYYLFDLGSFNGSYLNGARVTAARHLKSGDVINLSDHEFRFDLEGVGMTSSDLHSFGGSTVALVRSNPVVILVSDIKGFTALSEALEPDSLARIIGGWYSDCEQILTEEGGTVDKFVGDSVLAYWTSADEASLDAALRVATRLLNSCKNLYHGHPEIFGQTKRSFEIGVAIHTGTVAYGGMSQGESTLVGDPVNLTFRLEAMTRKLERDVLLSSDIVAALPALSSRCDNLGRHKVKGRSKSVEIFALRLEPQT